METFFKGADTMKKLFALVLVLALLLSGCGWSVEIVDPREDNASIEKEPETEEISEDLVEEIVLAFGAEKLEDGTFISDKTGGFLYETPFNSASALEMKYYFYWAAGEFSRRYGEDISKFASPHGIGYSFPAEEFEEIIESYFGVGYKTLRKNKDFYCSEHGAYCSPGGGVGFGQQFEIKILSYVKIENELSILLSVGDTLNYLNVLLTENGGFRFLSYVPEKTNSAEAPSENSGETETENQSLLFKEGPNGEPKTLSVGDSIGNWVLDDLKVYSYIENGEKCYDSASAIFSGTATLAGYISLNPQEGPGYYFTMRNDEDFKKVPGVAEEGLNFFETCFKIGEPNVENLPDLKEGESFPCYLTIDRYSINAAYNDAFNSANVVKIEPMVKNTGLSEFHEEIILNFGGEINIYKELVADKGSSLFYHDGFSDGTKLSETNYFIWMIHYSNSKYDYETRMELFNGAGEGNGWAYPSEYYESTLYEYFGVSAEVLRSGELYIAEKDYYWIGGGGGIGDTPNIIVNSIEENEDIIVFHITLDYSIEADCDMALTVKLLPEGGYNYVSYLPE